jgi:putative transposase
MSEQYKAFDAEAPYFITFTLVEWIPLLNIPEFASMLIDSLKFCVQNKGISIFGYCIMPSHVHLIVKSELYPLGSVIRDIKKFTASQISHRTETVEKYHEYFKVFQNSATGIKRNKHVKIWQDGYHPEIIISNKFFFQKLNYIHNNPVVAGFAARSEDYYYSSARNYAGLDAPLEIIFESQQLTSY